jgi:hypothetical protein
MRFPEEQILGGIMDDLDTLRQMLPFLIPIFLLEIGLLVWALIDVLKREHVTGGNKVVWILVIIFVSILGPLIYFIFGRKEGPVEEG